MIKKRIYTDLFIRDLTFVDKTSQNIIDLTNANNIKLFVRKHGIKDWIEQEKTIINNKISFQWNATKNTTIGTYDVLLSYDKESTTSETGKIEYKYDAISLFQIVNTSEDELNVDGMTTVQVVYYGGSDGLSAYQLAVKHGYTGTEEEFAQIESNNADAEVARQTSEEGRVIAEGERDNAEKARISAEASRSAAFNGLVDATNNINVDKLIPLSTGYYTLSTAITALASNNITKSGMVIIFRSSANEFQSYQFVGDIANFTDIS